MYIVGRLLEYKLINTLVRYYSFARQTHYEVLKLRKNCTEKEIKAAFIKMSKEYHPDKNKDAAAQEKFVQIVEAYNVLSKPRSRARYDSTTDTPSSAYVYKTSPYKHLSVIKRTEDPICPQCKEREETSYHFMAECPMYASLRWELFGVDKLKEEDLKQLTISQLSSMRRTAYNQYAYQYQNQSQKSQDKSQSDSFYGIKGLKKVPNHVIILVCCGLALVGCFFQMFVIRELYVTQRRQALEKSKRLAEELERVREAAKGNVNEVHTRLLLEKIVTAANPTVATASLGQALASEKKETGDLLTELVVSDLLEQEAHSIYERNAMQGNHSSYTFCNWCLR